MKKIIYIMVALFLLGGNVIAQKKAEIRGDEEFEDYSFRDAQSSYLRLAEDGNTGRNLLQRLADSYYFTADYENASKWYGVLYENHPNLEPEYLYRYALSLKSVENYTESDAIMEKFYTLTGDDKRKELFNKNRDYLAEIKAQSGRFIIHKLGINSKLSDFAPAFYGNTLVFASNSARGKVASRKHMWNDQPFLDFYTVNRTDALSGRRVSTLEGGALNTKYHESTAVFTKDGKTVYFTRNNFNKGDYKSDKDGTNRLKLYRGFLGENGKWEIGEVPFNSDEYSVAHPALSADEKTLYFASDMPGGIGMSDIYKVSLEGEGFGTPKNLGGDINTEGRDTFPFVSSDSMMYFSSDGHPGLGGLDVFVADLTSSRFDEVYNVGEPVNSSVDDFTFIVDAETKEGYFASNRKDGKGYDDIYGFTQESDLVLPCMQAITGQVKNKRTNKVIANAIVELVDEQEKVVGRTVTNANGEFNLGVVACEEDFTLQCSKKTFIPASKPVATSNERNAMISELLYLESEEPAVTVGTDLNDVLLLENINFDLDRSVIRPDAAIELKKVIAYMKKYPKVKVDVRSHTDSRGTDEYNRVLSDRRAKSTIAYIIKEGNFSANRISGKGYGESQLLNECANGVKCADYKHEKNRRSEFIVIDK